MKTFKYLCIAATAVFAFAGCRKDLMTFEGRPSVYFSFGGWTSGAVDSTSLSLVGSNGLPSDMVISIAVDVMGLPVGYDREIAVDVPNDGYSTAVEGRDFELLESVIPADSVWGVVQVKLINSQQLTASGIGGLKFKIRLLPNEHFDTEMSALSDQEVVKDEERSKYKMNSLNYKIKFNNDVVMSMLWNQNDYPRDNEYNSWVNYWGTFSPEKIQMIIEASDGGITEEELYPTAEFIALKTPNVPANPTYAKMQVYTSARRNAAWAANFNKLLANYQLEHGSRMIDEYNTKLSGKTVYMELGPDGAKVY